MEAASLPAAAGESDSGPAAPQSDVRRQLHFEFKFSAPARDPAPAAPFLSGAAILPEPEAPPPDVGDTVTMAPFRVREALNLDRLHADILQQRAKARTAGFMGKLGVGVYTRPVGAGTFYVGTIFYIPFELGFTLSF
ncbi:MAG TPA: hypothetical protein VN877_05310 [Opitutaceae bacterium]|nr:hypothetical protein [Opitutaceae bacterium]